MREFESLTGAAIHASGTPHHSAVPGPRQAGREGDDGRATIQKRQTGVYLADAGLPRASNNAEQRGRNQQLAEPVGHSETSGMTLRPRGACGT